MSIESNSKTRKHTFCSDIHMNIGYTVRDGILNTFDWTSNLIWPLSLLLMSPGHKPTSSKLVSAHAFSCGQIFNCLQTGGNQINCRVTSCLTYNWYPYAKSDKVSESGNFHLILVYISDISCVDSLIQATDFTLFIWHIRWTAKLTN